MTADEKAIAEEKLYKDGADLKTQSFKCPNCGGTSVFSPKDQKMKCEFCGTLFAIDESLKVQEIDIQDLLNNGEVWKETEVFQCNNCGAKEILPKQEIATKCSFCGTTNIVKTTEMSGLKPQGVVPFAIDKEMSADFARKWAKKRLFAPNDFKKSAKTENIHGVYNPAFTFDSLTDSTYNGVLGKYHTVMRSVNGKMQATQELRTFRISGKHQAKFDDVLVQASSNIPAGTLSKIEPFDTNEAPVYREEFLNGYIASTYNKDGKFCWQEGQSIIRTRIEQQILKKYKYDVKQSFNLITSFANITYKYILLPIYVGHYNYKNKLYNFFVNGQSGKITGKTPVSFWKVLFASILGVIVAGGVIAITMMTGGE